MAQGRTPQRSQPISAFPPAEDHTVDGMCAQISLTERKSTIRPSNATTHSQETSHLQQADPKDPKDLKAEEGEFPAEFDAAIQEKSECKIGFKIALDEQVWGGQRED